MLDYIGKILVDIPNEEAHTTDQTMLAFASDTPSAVGRILFHGELPTNVRTLVTVAAPEEQVTTYASRATRKDKSYSRSATTGQALHEYESSADASSGSRVGLSKPRVASKSLQEPATCTVPVPSSINPLDPGVVRVCPPTDNSHNPFADPTKPSNQPNKSHRTTRTFSHADQINLHKSVLPAVHEQTERCSSIDTIHPSIAHKPSNDTDSKNASTQVPYKFSSPVLKHVAEQATIDNVASHLAPSRDTIEARYDAISAASAAPAALATTTVTDTTAVPAASATSNESARADCRVEEERSANSRGTFPSQKLIEQPAVAQEDQPIHRLESKSNRHHRQDVIPDTAENQSTERKLVCPALPETPHSTCSLNTATDQKSGEASIAYYESEYAQHIANSLDGTVTGMTPSMAQTRDYASPQHATALRKAAISQNEHEDTLKESEDKLPVADITSSTNTPHAQNLVQQKSPSRTLMLHNRLLAKAAARDAVWDEYGDQVSIARMALEQKHHGESTREYMVSEQILASVRNETSSQQKHVSPTRSVPPLKLRPPVGANETHVTSTSSGRDYASARTQNPSSRERGRAPSRSLPTGTQKEQSQARPAPALLTRGRPIAQRGAVSRSRGRARPMRRLVAAPPTGSQAGHRPSATPAISGSSTLSTHAALRDDSIPDK